MFILILISVYFYSNIFLFSKKQLNWMKCPTTQPREEESIGKLIHTNNNDMQIGLGR